MRVGVPIAPLRQHVAEYRTDGKPRVGVDGLVIEGQAPIASGIGSGVDDRRHRSDQAENGRQARGQHEAGHKRGRAGENREAHEIADEQLRDAPASHASRRQPRDRRIDAAAGRCRCGRAGKPSRSRIQASFHLSVPRLCRAVDSYPGSTRFADAQRSGRVVWSRRPVPALVCTITRLGCATARLVDGSGRTRGLEPSSPSLVCE